MNRKKNNTARIDSVTPEQVAEAYVGGVARVDADRASVYAGLGTLRSAQTSTLNREQRLLARKYGDQDPRVLAVKTRIDANAVLQRDLAVAVNVAATPAPGVDDNTYVFHGHVRDERRKPLPGLTVALYTPEGEWLSELGYGCTDEKGYFILRLEHAPQDDEPPTVPASVEIRVYDASQKLLHREEEPLSPSLGVVAYREIIICPEGTCTPPPGAPDDPPPKPKTVPNVIGKTEDEAQAAIIKVGLTVESSTKETDSDRVGLVIEQEPKAGTKVAVGTVVNIVVGEPQTKITVPNFIGRTLGEATDAIKKLELALGTVQPDGAKPESKVVQQSPQAGAEVERGTVVDLVVDVPGEQVTVPNLVGRNLKEARAVLKEAGLRIGVIKPNGADAESIVIGQSPVADTAVEPGANVDVVVENAAPQVTVPNLVTLSLQDATGAIKKAELTLGVVKPDGATAESVVVEQSPEAGAVVEPRAPVDLMTRATGPGRTVTVPNLVGMPLSRARAALEEVRLKTGRLIPANPPDNGVVAKQSPNAGSAAEEETAVDLSIRAPVTDGPGRVITPIRRTATKRVRKKPGDKKG